MQKYCPTHGIVPNTHTHGRWAKGTQGNWRKVRAAALQRDGYRCTQPGCAQPAIEVHHVTDTVLRSVCAAHNPRGG